MSTTPEGAVEVIDDRFFIDGNEVSREEAEAAGWREDAAETPPPASSAAETPEASSNGADGEGSVMQRLRAAYAAGEGERTTVIPIAPGRYDGLAARYRPIDWELRRRLQRRAERTGNYGPEANLDFQAALIADACLAIVMRPGPGQDYVDLHELIGSMRAAGPIGYDTRLASVLGMSLVGGETEGDICRLVFGEEGAFEVHMTQLTNWSTQIAGDDEDEDEDGEGAERPM